MTEGTSYKAKIWIAESLVIADIALNCFWHNSYLICATLLIHGSLLLDFVLVVMETVLPQLGYIGFMKLKRMAFLWVVRLIIELAYRFNDTYPFPVALAVVRCGLSISFYSVTLDSMLELGKTKYSDIRFDADVDYQLTSSPTTVNDPMEVLLSKRYTELRVGPRYQLAEPLGFFDQLQVRPESLFESCIVRSIFSGVAGLGFGALMGGFFHTMQPVDHLANEQLSFKEQVKLQYKGFGANCVRMAKGFAKVGLVYSGIECAIEKERAQRDIPNAMYAGCLTGAVLVYQGGPQAMGMGCMGFAVFSAAIEAFMNHS